MIEQINLNGAYELRGKKIEQLQEIIRKKDVSFEKACAENLNLRDENSALSKARAELDAVSENQKYQLGQYAKELTQLQEEIQALKVFARRYLDA